jgi:hypothetical protein
MIGFCAAAIIEASVMPPKTSNLFIFLMGRKIILCKGSEKFEKVSKREGIIVSMHDKLV